MFILYIEIKFLFYFLKFFINNMNVRLIKYFHYGKKIDKENVCKD